MLDLVSNMCVYTHCTAPYSLEHTTGGESGGGGPFSVLSEIVVRRRRALKGGGALSEISSKVDQLTTGTGWTVNLFPIYVIVRISRAKRFCDGSLQDKI